MVHFICFHAVSCVVCTVNNGCVNETLYCAVQAIEFLGVIVLESDRMICEGLRMKVQSTTLTLGNLKN